MQLGRVKVYWCVPWSWAANSHHLLVQSSSSFLTVRSSLCVHVATCLYSYCYVQCISQNHGNHAALSQWNQTCELRPESGWLPLYVFIHSMQGFRGLYKGLPPTLLAATPFYATVFFGNNIGKRLQKQQPGQQLRYVGQSLKLPLHVEQVLHIIHAASCSCLLKFQRLLSHACVCISSPITFCTSNR